MKATGEIDWRADHWFKAYWHDLLTDEFKAWWVGEYGAPDHWNDPDDRREYWTRCGFALMGWLAGRKQALEATDRE